MKILRVFLIAFFFLFLGFGKPISAQVIPIQQLFLMKQLLPNLTTVGIMWNPKEIDTETLLKKIGKASASLKLKIVIANAESLKDVSGEFKSLVNDHNIGVLWIVEADKILNNKVSKEFLVKNCVLNKLPLLAPDTDWLGSGACMAIQKVDGKTKLFVNPKTAKAVSIEVPETLLSKTEFYASK